MYTWLSLLFNLILAVNGSHKHHRYTRGPLVTENAAKRDKAIGEIPSDKIPDLDDLPDLEALMEKGAKIWSKGGDVIKKFKILGCELDVKINGCKMVLIPDEKTCKDTLSLGTLTKLLMKCDDLRETAGKFIPFEVFQIEKLKLNTCTNMVHFETKAKERFDVIKDKMEMRKGKLSLRFNYKEIAKNMTFDKLGFDIQGEVKVGQKSVPLQLSKKEGMQDGKMAIKPKENMEVADVTAMFKKNLMADIAQDVGGEGSELFGKAKIKDPQMSGSRDDSGAYEVAVAGEVSGIPEIEGSKMHIIAQKQLEDPLAVAVMFDVKATPPLKALFTLTKKDLNEIPLLKDYNADMVIEYASNDIMLLKDAKVPKLIGNYVTNGKTITKGLKLKVPIPMKKIVERTGTKTEGKNIPEKVYAQIHIENTEVMIQFPQNSTMDLLSALAALTPKVPDFLFHKVVRTPPQVNIERFSVNLLTDEVLLQIKAPKNVVLGDGLIAIEDARFTLRHKPRGSWDFQICAKKNIAGGSMDVSVKREGDDYEFIGKINGITTKALVEHFGAATKDSTKITPGKDKGKLVSALEELRKKEDAAIFDRMKFLNFEIRDVDIESSFGGKMKLQIKGKPIIFDWDATFEGFMLNHDDKERGIVFGVSLKKIDLDDFIQKLYGKRVLQLSWMTDLTANIIISNTDHSSGFEFTTPELKPIIEIRKGVTLKTKVTIPEECHREPLCEVVKDKMKTGTVLHLEGDVLPTGVALRGTFTGRAIPFGDNMMLMNVALVVSVSFENTLIYFEGEMKFIKQNLSFKAKLGLSAVGTVELAIAFDGTWTVPFGLEYISFSDVKGSVGILPGVPVPKLGLLGTVCFGKQGNGTLIYAESAIGFSPSNSLYNYFYASINNLTLATLVDAFEISILTLPDAVMSIMFPDGMILGYAANPKGKDVESLNIKLTNGIMLQGRINIMGFQLQGKVLVTVPEKIEIKAELNVVDIGAGMIKLRRSLGDREKGPQIYVLISPEEVAVKIGAYAELMGMGGEVAIEVSNEGIFFNIYGNLFNVVEANVTVAAPYSLDGDLQSTEFFVSGYLASSLEDITKEGKKAVIEAADALAGAVAETQESMNKAGSWYDRAMRKLDFWNKKMEEKQAKIDAKSVKLDNITEYLNSSCVEKCPEVCLGGFVKRTKCKKLFGRWQSCPEWDDCKTKVDDPLCLAKCKAQKVHLHCKGLQKRVTMEVLQQNIEMTQKFEEEIHKFVNASKDFTKLVEDASVKLEQASASGRRAIFAIANYSKEHLIDIHGIAFNSTLGDAQEGCFAFITNVTLGGEENMLYDVNACLNTDFVKKFGKAVAEQIFPGISSIKDILKQAKDYFRNAKSKNEDMFTKARQTEEAEKEFEGKLAKCKINEDDEDDNPGDGLKKQEEAFNFIKRDGGYVRHQIYGDFPSVVIRDDATMDSFNRKSPWAFSEKESPFDVRDSVENETDTITDISTGDKDTRELSLDNLMTSVEGDNATASNCTTFRYVIDTYREISDSLTQLVNNAIEQEERYHKNARDYAKKMSIAEKEIIANSKALNFTQEQSEDALFYMQKLKNGTSRWLQNIDNQLVTLDKEILNEWRNSFVSILVEKSIDVAMFINTLMKESMDAEKKLTPNLMRRNVFGGSLVHSTKILSELISGGNHPLSGKREAIEKLREHVMDMADIETKMKCSHSITEGIL